MYGLQGWKWIFHRVNKLWGILADFTDWIFLPIFSCFIFFLWKLFTTLLVCFSSITHAKQQAGVVVMRGLVNSFQFSMKSLLPFLHYLMKIIIIFYFIHLHTEKHNFLCRHFYALLYSTFERYNKRQRQKREKNRGDENFLDFITPQKRNDDKLFCIKFALLFSSTTDFFVKLVELLVYSVRSEEQGKVVNMYQYQYHHRQIIMRYYHYH